MVTRRKLWKITWMMAAAAALVLVAVVASEVISQAGPYQDATPPTGQLHPERWSDRTVTIADLGHATLLMNWYGVRVLTDPTLFNRVGMSNRIVADGRTDSPFRTAACAGTIAKPRRHPHNARAHGPSGYPVIARPA